MELHALTLVARSYALLMKAMSMTASKQGYIYTHSTLKLCFQVQRFWWLGVTKCSAAKQQKSELDPWPIVYLLKWQQCAGRRYSGHTRVPTPAWLRVIKYYIVIVTTHGPPANHNTPS